MEYRYPNNLGKKIVKYNTQEERDVAIRASYFKNKYGLSLGEYNAMLVGQGRVCRICKEVMPDGKRFNVDHELNPEPIQD